MADPVRDGEATDADGLDGIADDLRALAALHAAEPSVELLEALQATPEHRWLSMTLEGDLAARGLRLMRDAVEAVSPRGDRASLDALAVDYAEIYLLFACRASPSESPWFDDEGLERQAAMFAVRDVYRRHGLTVADWRKRPDDHLVTELEFLAHLFDTGDPSDLVASASFLDEHLLRWVPHFATRVAERCATPFFAGVALLTHGYLEELRDLVVVLSGCERRVVMPMKADARTPPPGGCAPR